MARSLNVSVCCLLLNWLPWLQWLTPVVNCGIGTSVKYISLANGSQSINIDKTACGRAVIDSRYAGFRISTSGDDCKPVTNTQLFTYGVVSGYQYLLKKHFHYKATLPDNIAPNPAEDYIRIPGVMPVGSSVEYIYTKTKSVGYIVDFEDEGQEKLVMRFNVEEDRSRVRMNSRNLVTGLWDRTIYCNGFPFTTHQQYRLKFTFTGTEIKVFVNDNLYTEFQHRYSFSQTRWTRFSLNPVNYGIHVSDLKVTLTY